MQLAAMERTVPSMSAADSWVLYIDQSLAPPTCGLVPEHSMPLAKGASLTVLASEPDVIVAPVEAPAQGC
jgi:hypothetical protein